MAGHIGRSNVVFSPGAATLVKYSLRVSATKAESVTVFSLSRRTMLLCLLWLEFGKSDFIFFRNSAGFLTEHDAS